jgi:hypothetical protein
MSPAIFAEGLWKQFGDWRLVVVLVAYLPLWWTAEAGVRRLAEPWALALLLALPYRPIHPRLHLYLALALSLTLALNIGILAALALASRVLPPWLRLTAVALLLVVGVPGWPRFARPARSFDALPDLVRGAMPVRVPSGAEDSFPPLSGWAHYSWSDYRRLIAYLRQKTGPETRVATILRNRPFLAVNGPTGRISPFPLESGIYHVGWIDATKEADCIDALEQLRGDSVVVWAPDEKGFAPSFQFERLLRTMRRLYQPQARIGIFEVWRRQPQP